MTKVQIQFTLRKPLDETNLTQLSNASSIYGIHRIRLSPSLDGLNVEYDATRLKPTDVEAALARAGIRVEPQK